MNNRKILLTNKTTDNRKKVLTYFFVKRANLLLIILLISVIGLELFNIFLSNRVSTDSIEASQLKKEVALYTQQNNILKSKIYEYAAFDSVASRAAEFGFQEATDSITLDSPIEVAHQ